MTWQVTSRCLFHPGNPGIDKFFEDIERHRPGSERDIVKIANVESIAQRRPGTVGQCEALQVSDPLGHRPAGRRGCRESCPPGLGSHPNGALRTTTAALSTPAKATQAR